jgi:peptidoglycan/xylan/chitin deacetylase (PgdA/CDA1 family)
MHLTVSVPPGHDPERRYALSVVIGELLGLPYVVETNDKPGVSITSDDGKILSMPDVFFGIPDSDWLGPSSLPGHPLPVWDAGELGAGGLCVSPEVPVIFGRRDGKPVVQGSACINLPIDIFGSCFFMLSRYEEAVSARRDAHDRFPAVESIAWKAGFLDRPIVDEYVGILWTAMERIWPGLRRRPLRPRTRVTCDVDSPYSGNVKSPVMTLKNMAGDLIWRKSAVAALRTGLNTLCSSWGDYRFDPMNTFDWIMDVNEKAGNRVAFYFMAGCPADAMNGCYSIHEPRIRALMRRIHARGHEIGLHGGYGSYLDEAQCVKEAGILREVMESEGICQAGMGNRQHYLRWRTPETARCLEKAGMEYDSTLGYADRPGFRCGTSFPYPMYDLTGRKPLRLRQHPLVLMEGTVVDDSYIGMGYTERALDLMLELKRRALRPGGNFTLLWHNSALGSDAARRMYRELVA